MEIVEIVMNPVRQRIFQYLLIHETGAVCRRLGGILYL